MVRCPGPSTSATAVPCHVPEIQLYQADESVGLWDAGGGGYSSERPPPFWAFAWAGVAGRLARHVLDHPETVAGRRVLDLAAGSGLVAVAAARGRRARVTAVDVDPDAVDAIARNARANAVTVSSRRSAIRSTATRAFDAADVVAGRRRVLQRRVWPAGWLGFLRRAAAAARWDCCRRRRSGFLPAGAVPRRRDLRGAPRPWRWRTTGRRETTVWQPLRRQHVHDETQRAGR